MDLEQIATEFLFVGIISTHAIEQLNKSREKNPGGGTFFKIELKICPFCHFCSSFQMHATVNIVQQIYARTQMPFLQKEILLQFVPGPAHNMARMTGLKSSQSKVIILSLSKDVTFQNGPGDVIAAYLRSGSQYVDNTQ